jgi:hypothetical protein
MTREQQIEAALELISPPPGRRDQCRGNIEYMLDRMAAASGSNVDLKAIRAKAGARAWEAHHRALRRLLATHDKLTAAGWGGKIERAAIERAIHATTPEQYRRERARHEAYACSINLAHPSYDASPSAGLEQARAVDLAYDLLMQWWDSDEFITTTRGRPWWRLSAIFYGDPDADLYRYLRAFLNTPGPKISQQVF